MINANRNSAVGYRRRGGLNLGPELHTSACATSDPNGNEADATTDWGGVNLAGTGANVFESQAVVKDVGSYALHSDANDTPTGNARFEIQITVEDAEEYYITSRWRHIGTGGIWEHQIDDGAVLHIVQQVDAPDVTFRSTTKTVTATGVILIVRYREKSATNNGGVYADNLSVRKIL